MTDGHLASPDFSQLHGRRIEMRTLLLLWVDQMSAASCGDEGGKSRGATMSEDVLPPYRKAHLNFPATCPERGKSVVMNFRPDYLRGKLSSGQPIEMYASCHDETWDASASEVEQLRSRLQQ
jgi:hypothetical protein